MDPIYKYLLEGFKKAAAGRAENHRIGAELKFPLVNDDGTAASLETIVASWRYLEERGWKTVHDSASDAIIGASKPGEQNDTLASCETAFCKPEFSLAHAGNLHDLQKSVEELKEELRPFAEQHNVHFLCYGIQPVTPPSERLMMKKTRTSVWDKIFGANRHIAEEDGDDVCLFTVNAATHVHVSVGLEEAVPAVNVLNGFSGAQIALTADSNIWRGRIDPDYKCVAEKLWDWWIPEPGRVGVPEKRFEDLEDYARTISKFKPVYVKRDGMPVLLENHQTFADYYGDASPVGVCCVEGKEVDLEPCTADIDLHSTCYWYNSRLSRYYTVENRTNDQQPPGELLSISALTLGLISALNEADEALRRYDWNALREAREEACKNGIAGATGKFKLADLAEEMLDLAERGLVSRGLGEEKFLEPMKNRLALRKCPADDAAETFRAGGIKKLIEERKL